MSTTSFLGALFFVHLIFFGLISEVLNQHVLLRDVF